jgi:hypothetical protein
MGEQYVLPKLIGTIAATAALCLALGIGGQAEDLSKYPDGSGQWKTSGNTQTIFGAQWDPTKPPGPPNRPR